MRLHVGQVDRTCGEEVDGARDAAVPPLILVLDVARVRPLDHPQPDRVRTRPEQARQVELRRQVRVLAEPGQALVDVRGEHALGCADVQDHATARPALGQIESALVHAGRVHIGHLRR